MKEIEFIGKCIISGNFVLGDLIHGVGHKSGNTYILPCKQNLAYVNYCDPLDGVQVDPKTVGLYIGIKDKNNNKLYKGDIIRFKVVSNIAIGSKSKSIGYINWDDEDAGFFIENSDDKFPHVKLWFAYDYEKIGNIHQNPELLTIK